MRKIKFRAKSLEGHNIGEWVFGDLHIRSAFPHIHTEVGTRCKIDTNTIGQFTVLLDGNGQEIFEGDIMRIPETEFNIEIIGVVEFYRGSYVVRSFFSGTHSCLAWAVRERQSGERRGVVIGNIHDNPELLK